MTDYRATPSLAFLLQGLTPAEVQEFSDAALYFGEKAGRNGTGRLAEGSVISVINKLSPNVQGRFKLLSQSLEIPRVYPFAPKMGEADYADALGMDPHATVMVKAAIDALEVGHGTVMRMGGYDEAQPEQPSLYNDIRRAFEATPTARLRAGDTEADGVRAVPEHLTRAIERNMGSEIDLRTYLSAAVTQKADDFDPQYPAGQDRDSRIEVTDSQTEANGMASDLTDAAEHLSLRETLEIATEFDHGND